MERITVKHLRPIISRLNKMTNSPAEYWDRKTHKAHVGHFLLDKCYGGYQLQRVFNEDGGATCPLGSYRLSAREMYHVLQAFMEGLRQGQGGLDNV